MNTSHQPAPCPATETVDNTACENCSLHATVALLVKRLEERGNNPVDVLSIHEKVRITQKAHASGSRAEVIKANRLINGL